MILQMISIGKRMGLPVLGILLSFCLQCSAGEMETNAVEVGVWTSQFTEALRLSTTNHQPMLVVVRAKDCPFCMRMGEALANPAFTNWSRAVGLYLVEAYFSETNSSPVQAQAVSFVRASKFLGKHAYPFMAVYWPREKGEEVRLAFPGRRGLMPGKRGTPSLEAEAVSAVREVLADYFKQPALASIKPFSQFMIRRIQVKCEGPGTVSMRPQSGELKSKRATVYLTAVGAPGAVFKGWKDPNGRFLSHRLPQVGIKYKMPEGEYTAVFEGGN